MRKLAQLVMARVNSGGAHRYEDGFEIAQSMGIALLGLVVAAAFATALDALGVDVINRIRAELGL